MVDHKAEMSTPPAALDDSGLRCPRCEYNLTGLTDARCPECGTAFDWEAVRRASKDTPTIAFERARGWRKLPAFFVTWATVLFAPWVFARQVVARTSGWHALVFGVVCFVPVTARLVWEKSGDACLTWIGTAIVYVLLQAICLAAVDWSGWRRLLASLRFWVIIGGYTSAIVATEFVYGPVLLQFTNLARWLTELSTATSPSEFYGRMVAWPGFGNLMASNFNWLTLALWLAGLACVYARRLRSCNSRRLLVWLAVPLITAGLLILYVFCVENIADFLYGLVSPILP